MSKEIYRSHEQIEKSIGMLLRHVSDMVFLIQVENENAGVFRCIDINDTYEHVTGLSKNEIIGKRIEEIMDEPYATFVIQQYTKAISTQKVIHYNEHIQFPKGLIKMNIFLVPMFNKAGRCTHILGIASDISDADLGLDYLNHRFESVVQTAQDAIILADQHMEVIYWNRGAETIFGYQANEVLGKKLDIIIPDQYREAHKKGIERYLKTGEKKVLGRTIELSGLRKDGVEFPIELSLNSWRMGHKEYFSSIIRDITERKQSEEKLRKREEVYRKIVEHSPDAVIIIKDRKVLYINQTGVNLLGYNAKEELLHLSIYDYIHPDYHEAVEERLKRMEAGVSVELLEEVFVKKDGTLIDVEVKAIPTIFEDEPAFHVIVRDITERKRTRELLQDSEKRSVVGQLAAGIAHEIRNPLTSLKGFLQLMDQTEFAQTNYYQIMNSELERIEYISSELLVLAKPQSVEYKPVNIPQMLLNVIPLMETRAIMHNVEIITHLAEDIPYVKGDNNHLKQVFINFIKNAIEAMPKGGRIHIEVEVERQPTPQVIVSVKDEGRGIPENEIKKLGQPFYSTKEKGTGLGLMVSFKIIEDHGGWIEINSEVNKGTVISVHLPFDQSHTTNM
ncbi:PAS domain S-box protein [Caldalkalibacillus salinus]|uniref:PAS domain S-box protein n=1 Tax=Caldalkalibacillus salinus TaxID=2803787 RepID=UPI001921FF8F